MLHPKCHCSPSPSTHTLILHQPGKEELVPWDLHTSPRAGPCWDSDPMQGPQHHSGISTTWMDPSPMLGSLPYAGSPVPFQDPSPMPESLSHAQVLVPCQDTSPVPGSLSHAQISVHARIPVPCQDQHLTMGSQSHVRTSNVSLQGLTRERNESDPAFPPHPSPPSTSPGPCVLPGQLCSG